MPTCLFASCPHLGDLTLLMVGLTCCQFVVLWLNPSNFFFIPSIFFEIIKKIEYSFTYIKFKIFHVSGDFKPLSVCRSRPLELQTLTV